MKKTHKLLSIAAVVIVLSVAMTMATAANSLTISKVEVLNDDGVAVESYGTADLNTADINVQASQILSVTVTMTDGAETPAAVSNAAATFLSYLEGSETELSNDTIQFIDQVNTNRDGSVTFAFRPRTSLAKGDYVAKAGGADVASVAEFSYSFSEDLPNMNVSDVAPAFQKTQAPEAGITFSIKAESGGNSVTPSAPTTVRLGGTALTSSDYSYSESEGQLTINKAKLDTLGVGTYTLIISCPNYNQKVLTNAVTVNALQITEGDAESVTENLDSVVTAPTEKTDSITVATTVAGAEGGNTYDLVYEVTGNATMDGDTISLNEGVDFAKVVVEVNVEGSSTAVTTKTIYLYSEDAPAPTFGNVGLHTTGGSDAFKAVENQEDFVSMLEAYGESNKLADIATALNIAINNDKAEELPHFADALDFDRDGDFTLAEYRIYKLMMDGDDPIHTYAAVQAARPTAQ